MTAARHLHNWGASVELNVLAPKDRLKDIPAHQYQVLEKMGIVDGDDPNLGTADLIVDAMIGYGLTGNPRGRIADWIRAINESARSVLALDTPSGLNTTAGVPGDPCIRATATMTLALPKTGLKSQEALSYIGELYLADISVPRELYQQMGIDIPPIFNKNSIVKI